MKSIIPMKFSTMPVPAMAMKNQPPSVLSSAPEMRQKPHCWPRTAGVDVVRDALQRDEEGHGEQEQPVEEASQQLRAAPAVRQLVRVAAGMR